MGSSLESFYFAKPILCMPLGVEQFVNAITIKKLLAQSLRD
jgi:UDP:flavonoid glycosyltransferase YjiC (YdhE family)